MTYIALKNYFYLPEQVQKNKADINTLRNAFQLEYSDTTEYFKPQIVSVDGVAYIALRDTPFKGHYPPTSPDFWAVFASGPTGPQGPAGKDGVNGKDGKDGATGPAGPQGPAGATGPQGPAGPAGPQGYTGDVGPRGPQGIQGKEGFSLYLANAYIDANTTEVPLANILKPAGRTVQPYDILLSSYADTQGAYAYVTAINGNVAKIDYVGTTLQGPKGDTGATGPRGPQGPQGIQGEIGPKGDTGAQGPKGDKGDTGAQGPKGDTGDTGAQGPKGDKGDTGATGPIGPQGPVGPEGPQGPVGPQGPKGDTGPQGPSGALPDWVNATAATVLTDGVYIIAWDTLAGLAYITNGTNTGFEMGVLYEGDETTKTLIIYTGYITNGKFTNIKQAFISLTGGNITIDAEPITVGNYKYIKIK